MRLFSEKVATVKRRNIVIANEESVKLKSHGGTM